MFELGIVLICIAVVVLIFDIYYGCTNAKKIRTENSVPFKFKRNIGVILLIVTLLLFVVGISLLVSGNDVFGLISALGNTATPIFTIWFLFAFGNRKYKKSILILAITIISIVIAVIFNTTETEMYGRAIFYAGGTLLTVVGVFLLLVSGVRKVGLVAIVISLIFVFFVSEFFGMKFISQPKYNNTTNKPDGFIGSDGKYHEYIPEFGDEVNDWMEENW